MRRILMLIAVMLLAGCTTMVKQLNGSLTPPPGQAYAIVSLTGRAFIPDTATMQASWSGLDNGSSGIVYSSFVTDTVFGEQGMAPVEGRLALLRLAPGRYQIGDVWARWSDDTGFMSYQWVRHFRIDAPFEVKAGETVYLGNIWVDMSNLPELQLRNEQKRDFGHIHRVWHVPDTSSVRTELLVNSHPELAGPKY
ncbi:hypothetical protein OL229_03630 [Neisseriaceae bacterium JH1-16]|nr:hypothetical protein [Neisseriaceae bacterium JH1-16]